MKVVDQRQVKEVDETNIKMKQMGTAPSLREEKPQRPLKHTGADFLLNYL